MYIELWKWIPGYEGLYMVSTHGRVKTVDRYVENSKGVQRLLKGKIRKQSTYKSGYMYVGLYKNGKGKNCKIHRLVALAFIPNPNNLPEVNHKDENKTNNHVSNLEWCDRTYNNNYGTRIEKFRKSMQGFKHTEESKAKISTSRKGKYTGENSATAKAVLMFTLDGQFIKRFDCVVDAYEYLGKNRKNTNIGKCARGGQETAYGYIWKYEEDLTQEQEAQDTNK